MGCGCGRGGGGSGKVTSSYEVIVDDQVVATVPSILEARRQANERGGTVRANVS